ncbi:type III polyketide synthase [Streptomyces xiaopingdaonensis]|uniref:type III polyketide synthase n=1 Tax=Streptomyces xiaopingdaonensis TaxID=1565415 RepID=UPI000314C19D|nr:hypothetical protein [Streptomyces xiaopingdaonensis]
MQSADGSSRRNPGSGGPGAAAPRIAAVEVAVPPYRYTQEEIAETFAATCLPDDDRRRMLARISANAGVRTRHLSQPLHRYQELADFTDANSAWCSTACALGEEALRAALHRAGIAAEDVDLIASTTVTGLTVPSLEARLAERIGLREDVKRVPLFGLGCAAGAAGLARLHDYLRAFPEQVAVLLSVELCSLTVQRSDTATANLVASSLFGDGAAAAVVLGADRTEPATGPRMLATRSRLYPDSLSVMGWEIGADGFTIVLSPDVADVAEGELPKDVTGFLAEHDLVPADIASWVCHPGGPKVIEAVERGLQLPDGSLAHTRRSLSSLGNLSSASVLDVLRRTMHAPPPPGSPGLMTAMGPGFASELVLLDW